MAGHSIGDLDGHDPYELLGIARTATRAEIVAAHRKQVQLVHPDRPGGDEYETVLLHVARAVLLDPAQRAELDRRARPAPADDRGRPTGPAAPDVASPGGRTSRAPASAWDDEEVLDGAHPATHEPTDHRWEGDGHEWSEEHDDRAPIDDGHHGWQPVQQDPWYPQPSGGHQRPDEWRPVSHASVPGTSGAAPGVVSPWSIGALVLAVLSYPGQDMLGPVAVVVGLVRLIRSHGRTDRILALTALALGTVQTLLVLVGLGI